MPIRTRGQIFALSLAAVVTLTGCGGGEGSSDSPVQTGSVLEEEERAQILVSKSKGITTPAAPSPTGTTPFNDIVVRASSVPVQGTGAVIQLRYRGVVIADGEVTSTTLSDLRFKLPGNFGGDIFDLVFTNASFPNGTPARRLTVEGVYINGTRFSPTAVGVVYDLGHGLEAFDGVGVKAGANLLTETGALRFPLPAANQIGAASLGPADGFSPAPGPYVDIWFGADTNPGTRARPYRTLAALVGRTLLAGENIHLHCGNMWRETLALGVSELTDGTEIRRYGDDCAITGNPVVSGADLFNGGWSRNGAVWSRAVPAGTPQITRLFVGYTAMRPAQWPNADAPMAVLDGPVAGQPQRMRIGAAAATALSGRPLAGATALVRTTAWTIETHQIAPQGLQGQELALASTPGHAVKAGDAYVLRDLAWMLDAPGEFFHDTAAQRLYLIPAATDAALDMNSVAIEGSVRDVAIDLRGRSGIRLTQISARLARQVGIQLTNTPQARLLAVEARENGAAGIRLMQWYPLPTGSTGPSVENSLVAGNGEHGIDAKFARKSSIVGNRVLDTGLGTHVGTSLAGISAGPGSTIDGNVVDGSAYAGIMFSSLQGSLVARNEVSRYCLRLSDCGGLYTWSGEAGISPEQSSTRKNNHVRATRIARMGSGAGGHDVVAGIYLDEFTQGATVRGNFLQGMPTGVLLHNAARTTVENNTIWLASQSALWVTMSRTDADWSSGNLLQNNEIVPMVVAKGTWPSLPSFTISHPVWFTNLRSGQAALGAGRNEFANNRVVQVNGNLTQHAFIVGPSGQRHVDAVAWRELNPRETLPERPITFSTYFLDLGPEKVAGGQFDGGLAPWGSYWNWQAPAGGYEAQPVWSQPGCTGPCMRLKVAERGESIFSPPFTLTPGVPHLYRWTAVATQAPVVMGESYISRTQSPWSAINDGRGFVTLDSREIKPGAAKNFEAFFMPTAADSVRVNIQPETVGVPVHVDAVSVREIRGWWLSGPAQWMATIVAPRGASRTVSSCSEFGWPSSCALLSQGGTPVTLPLTVPPGSQQMVFWADSPYRK
jgi:hypothetical protein